MDAWVVSDDRALATRIRDTLVSLEVNCPASRVVDITSPEQFVSRITEPSDLVIFSVHQLVRPHLELLRQLRPLVDGTLVVVATIPDHATVLSAIRAGADDYLNSDGNLESELTDLTVRLKKSSPESVTQGRVFTIVPCHSAPDANFLAVNLAASWATKYGSCALLDFHLRGGVLALMLKLTPRHTLIDLIRQRQVVDGSMLEQALTHHESGIRLLAGPDLFSSLQGMHPHIFQQILEVVMSMEGHVVVDVEDLQHAEQVRALAKSDSIVLVMRLDIISLYIAQRHLEYLSRNGIPREQVHVAALASGESGELPIATVKQVLHVKTFHCIPDDPAATIISLNLGTPLVLESPKSKTTKALTQLAEALVGDENMRTPKKKTSKSFWKASAMVAAPVPALEQ